MPQIEEPLDILTTNPNKNKGAGNSVKNKYMCFIPYLTFDKYVIR
jgi:hypothetical protein